MRRGVDLLGLMLTFLVKVATCPTALGNVASVGALTITSNGPAAGMLPLFVTTMDVENFLPALADAELLAKVPETTICGASTWVVVTDEAMVAAPSAAWNWATR